MRRTFRLPLTSSYMEDDAAPNSPEWLDSPRETVRDEIARLAIKGSSAVTHPSPEKDGVDLTEYRSQVTGYTAYDRWKELTGTVKIGGRTLEERLGMQMRNRTYLQHLTDGNEDTDGSRMGLVKGIIGQYREYALYKLGKEMPELRQALLQAKIRAARGLVQQRAGMPGD